MSKLHGTDGGFFIIDDLANQIDVSWGAAGGPMVCDQCGLPIETGDIFYNRPTNAMPICQTCFTKPVQTGVPEVLQNLSTEIKAMGDSMAEASAFWSNMFGGAALGALMGNIMAPFNNIELNCRPIEMGTLKNTPNELKELIETVCRCANCSGSIKVTPRVIAWAKKNDRAKIMCEACIDKEAAGCSNSETRRRTISL